MPDIIHRHGPFCQTDDELAVAPKNGHALSQLSRDTRQERGADLYAFGLSAISQFENIYAKISRISRYYCSQIEAGMPATTSATE